MGTFTVSWPVDKNAEFVDLVKAMIEPILEYQIWNDEQCKYCNNSVSRRDPEYMTYHEEYCAYSKARDVNRFIKENFND